MNDPGQGDFHPGAKQVLTERDLHHFGGDTLFDALGRAVCEAGCLPRKELFEAWAVAKRARRRLGRGPVVDLACGHGLAAWCLLLLDPVEGPAICVDRRLPASAEILRDVLGRRWPRVAGRIRYVQGELEEAAVEPGGRVLAVHACGGLTDRALELAIAARADVAALPCCHSHAKQDDGGLSGWMDRDVAIDATRVGRLRAEGYRVWTATIPASITPENRLMLGVPAR